MAEQKYESNIEKEEKGVLDLEEEARLIEEIKTLAEQFGVHENLLLTHFGFSNKIIQTHKRGRSIC